MFGPLRRAGQRTHDYGAGVHPWYDYAVKTHGSLFHATRDPLSGEITVVRATQTRNGFENAFAFSNSVELRVALSPFFEHEDIESILQRIANSGSVDFVIST